MKLTDIFDIYLRYAEIYLKKGTFSYYKKNYTLLLKAFQVLKIDMVSDLKNESIDDLVIYLRDYSGKKNSKINSTISALYTALYYSNIQMKKQRKLVDDTTPFRAFSDDEVEKILIYCNGLDLMLSNNFSWVLAVKLFFETGARLNELVNLKVENICIDDKSIILEITKNGFERKAYYNFLSREMLERVIVEKEEYILWNRFTNTRLNKRSLEHFFNKMKRDTGIAKIHAHRFRKTFATRLLKRGCPLTTIQKLLGHSDIKMTMKYLEIDDEMIRNDFITYYPY